MNLQDKNILILSPEPWEHIFVSKHHYAVQLSNMGNRVFFANPPKNKWELTPSNHPNLFILDYTRFIPGLRLMPKLISQLSIKKKLDIIQKKYNVIFDIIWSFDNSVFFDFSLLTSSFNISHIVDLDQDFELEKAATTADLCLYTTKHIGKKLIRYNSNTRFINHGYNERSCSEKIVLPGKNKFKILYAGNLNMSKLDWKTMLSCTEDNIDVDFVLLGPLDRSQNELNETSGYREKILSKDNVYRHEKVHANDLINYYSAADALLICYQEKYFDDQSNPHKMMDYLGSGKPIVATWTSEFEKYARELILMPKKNNQLSKSIRELVKNYNHHNSDMKVEKRKEIAQSNTYSSHLHQIEKLIHP